MLAGGALCVVAAVVAYVVTSPDGASSRTTSDRAAVPPADPMKDADAWKALPEAERTRLANAYVASADAGTAAEVSRATEFLAARGETAAIDGIARRVLARDTENAWARAHLRHADVAGEADACIAECEQAEEANDASLAALKAERAKHPGMPWWVDEAETKRIRDLVAAARAAEARYSDPYQAGVAKWVRRQRAVDIMKDYPALHAAVGPYVIFVSLNVTRDPKASPEREVSMADVSPDELARGAKVLERNITVFSALYEGWMTEIAPLFGMERYGPANSDFKLLMKANVFAKQEDFEAFNDKAEVGVGGFARAYYSPMEPRFITTYDGGDDEDDAYADQVQCHEATHQLVHFYTWDLTRKDLGRDPDWIEVARRPLWSGEGFAEFFSSHRVVDGKYVWMQPLDERLCHIWVFEEMVKAKGWIPWRLNEFFNTLYHGGTLRSLSSARSTKSGDEWVAEGVMANLFYAKAWSFVYFLWYAEKDGKPKYRDAYVEYLKREFHVRFVRDPASGKETPAPVWSNALMNCLKIEGGEQLSALETEWNEFTAKLVAEHRKPKWDEERAKMRKNFGFDKPEKETK